MLTSKLEDLIWKGKAFPKTFCVGGTQKHVLNIQPDRFIIITDILYFPFFAYELREGSSKVTWEQIDQWIRFNYISTQLTILGEKNFNRFQFRNNIYFNAITPENNTFLAIPGSATHLDTYLIHTTGVSFSFSLGNILSPTDGNTLAESVAFNSPADYGKDGDTDIIPTTQINLIQSDNDFFNYVSRPVVNGENATNELAYPVDGGTNIPSYFRQYGNQHPILQVSYIEILGQPDNIGL